MKPSIDLLPGERVVYRSVRGGTAGHSVWWWLLAIFGFMQLGNVPFFLAAAFVPSDDPRPRPIGLSVFALATLAISAFLFVRWLDLKRRPSYVVTDQRVIARKVVGAPLVFDPASVELAARFLIKQTRYGRVVREILTHTVVVVFRSGASQRFGPVKDATELVDLLNGVAQRSVDLHALPGVNGEPARAEVRSDLFFARRSITSGMERGPLFVSPGALIGFAEALTPGRMLQLFSVVGAEHSADEIEARMIDLAHNTTFGRAVVMPREGTTLRLDGEHLTLSAAEREVTFKLTPEDARRAAAGFLKAELHPYR